MGRPEGHPSLDTRRCRPCSNESVASSAAPGSAGWRSSDDVHIGHAQLAFDWKNGMPCWAVWPSRRNVRGRGFAVPMLEMVLAEAFGHPGIVRLESTSSPSTRRRFGPIRGWASSSRAHAGRRLPSGTSAGTPSSWQCCGPNTAPSHKIERNLYINLLTKNKYILSFLKSDWTLKDYPVVFRQDDPDAPSCPGACAAPLDCQYCRLVPDVRLRRDEGRSYADLQRQFGNYKAGGGTLPRPGTIKFPESAPTPNSTHTTSWWMTSSRRSWSWIPAPAGLPTGPVSGNSSSRRRRSTIKNRRGLRRRCLDIESGNLWKSYSASARARNPRDRYLFRTCKFRVE